MIYRTSAVSWIKKEKEKIRRSEKPFWCYECSERENRRRKTTDFGKIRKILLHKSPKSDQIEWMLCEMWDVSCDRISWGQNNLCVLFFIFFFCVYTTFLVWVFHFIIMLLSVSVDAIEMAIKKPIGSIQNLYFFFFFNFQIRFDHFHFVYWLFAILCLVVLCLKRKISNPHPFGAFNFGIHGITVWKFIVFKD